MAEIFNNIVSRYRADTSQAEAAVKRLRGVERDRAKAQLDALNAENDKLNSQIALLGKVGAAVGAAVALWKGAQVAARAYLEDVRLESAAAGAQVDRLRAATQGLVETDTLLAFAGKAQHGVWRLNQQEMETVLEGANALRIRMGTELQPTVEKLTEALAKGSTRALKEFGIEAKDKEGALRSLRESVASLRGETSLTGDDFARAGVKWADAVDDLTGSFGRMALQLAPTVSKLAEMVGVVTDLVNGLNDLGLASGILTGPGKDAAMGAILGGPLAIFLDKRNQVPLFPPALQQPTVSAGPSGAWDLSIEERLRIMRGGSFDPWRTLSAGGTVPPDLAPRTGRTPTAFEGDADELVRIADRIIEGFQGLAAALPQALAETLHQGQGWRPIGEAAGDTSTGIEGISNGADAAARIAQANAAIFAQTRGRTMLEAIFGTPAEIDLTITSLQQVGSAFNIVSSAAGSAMDAWITGQKSLGRAFAEAIADGLKSLAVQATVEALKHTAFGIGALAFGPVMGATAAMHFKAAALFGATAIAAGAGAKALGGATGQWSGASSAPGAGAALGGGDRAAPPSTQPEQRQVVIMVGKDFLALTDLEQRQLTYQAIQLGTSGRVNTRNVRRS